MKTYNNNQFFFKRKRKYCRWYSPSSRTHQKRTGLSKVDWRNVPLFAFQILMIKEIYKNTEFTCHARNEIGSTKRVVNVIVSGRFESGRIPLKFGVNFCLGPGSAPILSSINAARTSVDVKWAPPHVINRPVTSYTVYYSADNQMPVKSWPSVQVDGRFYYIQYSSIFFFFRAAIEDNHWRFGTEYRLHNSNPCQRQFGAGKVVESSYCIYAETG